MKRVRQPAHERMSENERAKQFARHSDGKHMHPDEAIRRIQAKINKLFGVHLDDYGMARLFMDVLHQRLAHVATVHLKNWDTKFIQRCARELQNRHAESNPKESNTSLSENSHLLEHLQPFHEVVLEPPSPRDDYKEQHESPSQ